MRLMILFAALALTGCTLGSGYLLSPTDKCYMMKIEKGGEIQIQGGPVVIEMTGPASYESTGKDCTP